MHPTELGSTSICVLADVSVSLIQSALTPAGPDIRKGCVTLSFFERRVKKSMFHLMSNEEKVVVYGVHLVFPDHFRVSEMCHL